MARQGFFNKLIMGSDNMPDFTPEQLPKSRWALFFDVFKNRLFPLFKVSLLTDIFAIPLILIILFDIINTSTYNAIIPYDGNVGIGYPVEPNAQAISDFVSLNNGVTTLALMVFGIIIFSIGLAGAFYVVRRIVWGEPVEVLRHFGHGIKSSFTSFLLIGSVFGLSFFMMMFNFLVYGKYDIPEFVSVLLSIISVAQFVITTCVTFYVMAQSVTYNMKFMQLVRNSMIFGFALLPQTVFFIALAILPIVLAAILPIMLSPGIYAIYAFIGFGYSVLVLTVFAHYVFDKYLNDRVKGAKKNRGMYVEDPEEKKRREIERIKSHNTIYGGAYVAKKLSSIDSGSEITPLSSSYSRSDIMKLTEEKKKIEEEIRTERELAEAEVMKQVEEYDFEQQVYAKTKKKKKKKD